MILISIIKINNNLYKVFLSRRKNKKYDVYKLDNEGNAKYLLSFGDKRYQHYYDQFGYYNKLNHLDDKRRMNYLKRSGTKNIDNVNSANYWARNFLW